MIVAVIRDSEAHTSFGSGFFRFRHWTHNFLINTLLFQDGNKTRGRGDLAKPNKQTNKQMLSSTDKKLSKTISVYKIKVCCNCSFSHKKGVHEVIISTELWLSLSILQHFYNHVFPGNSNGFCNAVSEDYQIKPRACCQSELTLMKDELWSSHASTSQSVWFMLHCAVIMTSLNSLWLLCRWE